LHTLAEAHDTPYSADELTLGGLFSDDADHVAAETPPGRANKDKTRASSARRPRIEDFTAPFRSNSNPSAGRTASVKITRDRKSFPDLSTDLYVFFE
jgi:hypothetical protein